MAETTHLTASCQCKTCTWTFTLPTASLPLPAHLCHCDSCRRTHGALATYHARAPAPPSPVFDSMTAYPTSTYSTRYFCSTCGTHMGDQKPESGRWTLSTAVVDRSDGVFDFDYHIFVCDQPDGGMADWVAVVDGKTVKRWARHVGDGEVEAGWSQEKTGGLTAATAERLEGSCQCGGVQFEIQRPGMSSSEVADVFARMDRFEEHTLLGLRRPESKNEHPGRWPGQNCTCGLCRLASGCDIMPWVYVLSDRISSKEDGSFQDCFGTLKEYRAANSKLVRRFCGKCGALVSAHDEPSPEAFAVAAGLLMDKSGAKAEEWVAWSEVVGCAEDGLNKSLVKGLQSGVKDWTTAK
ncbi:hypothetical protein K402DRAFT_390339 [Aulographum hederae CBS 113979]|uniref:CENP-V/GFA domain-containing protein n=1 Tax=Aulographum hederae CBS 113979 TaxID=1176131 RepID=A0A6G1H9W3_9PEZI|nr:hypothetical protein K402DRAFT_390339 [Aulographum hederae CBS 113979]